MCAKICEALQRCANVFEAQMRRHAKICENMPRHEAKMCKDTRKYAKIKCEDTRKGADVGKRYANVCEDMHVRIGVAMQTCAKLCEDMQDMRNVMRRCAKICEEAMR